MISENRVKSLVEQAKNEGVIGDVKSVLSHTMTVAELIKTLQQYDPETPVELEIPVEIDKSTDEMFSEVGFIIDAFESEGATKDGHVITLRACKPDMLQDYKNWMAGQEN